MTDFDEPNGGMLEWLWSTMLSVHQSVPTKPTHISPSLFLIPFLKPHSRALLMFCSSSPPPAPPLPRSTRALLCLPFLRDLQATREEGDKDELSGFSSHACCNGVLRMLQYIFSCSRLGFRRAFGFKSRHCCNGSLWILQWVSIIVGVLFFKMLFQFLHSTCCSSCCVVL